MISKCVATKFRRYALLSVREFHWSNCFKAQAQLPQLSPYDINQILREHEFTYTFPEANSVVLSYDTNQLGSNTPCEDCRSEASFIHKNAFISGVFDGHAGPACGQVISKRLMRYMAASSITRDQLREELAKGCNSKSFLKCYNDKVDFVKEIKDIYEDSFKQYIQELSGQCDTYIVEEMESAFLRLDHDLSKEALQHPNMRTLAVALSGAVACVAKVEGNNLFVANTGDCAAVMGSWDPLNSKWICKKVSTEHNADNIAELRRIYSEHPKSEQDSAIRNNRLLGQLAPLRAFGDFRYKWSNEVLNKLVVPVLGEKSIPSNYLTPPYLTAKPEVQHHVLSPNDKFLVLATDGLWDFLSPSSVVELVGEHLNSKKIIEPLKLPEGDVTLQRIATILRERKAGLTRKPMDTNVATHLIRNALGGTEYGIENSKIAYYLSLPKDVVRYYRDDITITVLYFNSEELGKLAQTETEDLEGGPEIAEKGSASQF